MRKICFLLFLCFQFTIGQNKESDTEEKTQVIDEVPIYPGCENGDNESRKLCLSVAVQNHIQKKYNARLLNQLNLPAEKTNVYVIFKIDKNGDVIDVKSRAPHPELEKEAIRVINLLPKMKPGITDGKPVTIPYAIPISLSKERTAADRKEKRRLKKIAKKLMKKKE